MTIKELYETLKEYELAKDTYYDIDSRISTEDNVPEFYYRARNEWEADMERIGSIEIGG